jgi:hypothetical protein
MSAYIISYPGCQPEQFPDRETLHAEIAERDKIENRIREVLNSKKHLWVLEQVLNSLTTEVRRESVELPRHSCPISQIHYTDLAVAIGWRDGQFQGYDVSRKTDPFLPRFVAIHSVSKIQRVFVLPDPQKPDFLALQMERTAARNLAYLKEGKIPEEYRTEVLLEIKEQLDFVEPIAKGKERSIFRRFRQQWIGGGQ